MSFIRALTQYFCSIFSTLLFTEYCLHPLLVYPHIAKQFSERQGLPCAERSRERKWWNSILGLLLVIDLSGPQLHTYLECWEPTHILKMYFHFMFNPASASSVTYNQRALAKHGGTPSSVYNLFFFFCSPLCLDLWVSHLHDWNQTMEQGYAQNYSPTLPPHQTGSLSCN